MVPTYNCASYLERTLESILAQDRGSEEMQIEVVDDHSEQDDPKGVVARIAKNRVGFFRQPKNVGHVRNFNTCVQRARGRFVHILHGDDIVNHGFYERLQEGFERAPQAGAAFCRTIYWDDREQEIGLSTLEREESGLIENWLEKIASRQRVGTPSMVVRREVYEALDGFDQRFRTAGEDWEMWVRIAAHFPVWFEPEALAIYRTRRPGSLTEVSASTAKVVREMRLACSIISEYLPRLMPPAEAEACLSAAGRFYAGWALITAEQLVTAQRRLAALPHLLEAYRCYPIRWTRNQCLRILKTRR